jgi:hypothetical protein
MILLVSGGTRVVKRLIQHPNLGVLLTPSAGNSPPPKGVVWACDNSAFSGFDEVRFVSMLQKIKDRPDCRWVAAPDVVGDHEATLSLWQKWCGIILEYGQTAAFVAQDGCTVESLPWGRGMAAVFIGGTTRFKLGSEAARIVHEANKRNLWTHMGRVNTLRRFVYAQTIGVRSVDGSSFSKWSETYIPRTLAFLSQLDRQKMVPLVPAW